MVQWFIDHFPSNQIIFNAEGWHLTNKRTRNPKIVKFSFFIIVITK